MAKLVTHKFVSSIPDGDDTGLVRPSNWNDTHDVSGVAESGTNTDITSMTGITGGISSPDYIQFDTTYATALTAGQLGWDGNDTLAVGMAGGNVIQHIGEDQFIYIKADAAITKGQVIMFTGAVGASGVLTGAPATGVTNPQYIMGVAAENLAHNAFGLVQTFGELTGLNTNAFNEGDVLYYDSAVTGGLTSTFPATGPIVTVASVAKKSGGNGVLVIRVTVTQRITAGAGATITQALTGTTVAVTNPYNPASVAITGGTINGTTIGATTPSSIVGTTITGQTGVLRGTGTNLVTQSQTFSTWTRNALGLSANSVQAPDGTTTAATFTGDGTSGTHTAQFTQSANSFARTWSCYLKAGTNNFVQLMFGTDVNAFANFDLNAGTLGTVGSAATATITSAGSGWYRCVVTTSSTTATNVFITLIASGTSVRFESNSLSTTIFAWGAQFELGSTANTYIPTTTTAVYGTPTLSFSGVSTLGLESNGALFLQPAGTGAIQAQATTSTATGGNARGANAVDWQTSRVAASQVSSSAYTTIGGGLNNTSNSFASTIAGGGSNGASNFYAFIGGGSGNQASGYSSVAIGGISNTASGYYGFVGNGFTNSTTSNSAVTTQSGTMNGTTAVTLSGSNANIRVGQYITGTSIAGDTYVAAISGTSLTLSKNASGSSTSTLSFFTPHGVVVGGGNNQATGSYSFIGGGGDAGTAANRNVASGAWSAVVGGTRNTASGIASFIGGGGTDGAGNYFANTASGAVSVISGGWNSTASGAFSVVAGGQSNVSSNSLSTIGGGTNNTADAFGSTVVGGTYGTTRAIVANIVFPACNQAIASANGVSQAALLVLAVQTTDATATALRSNTSAAGTTNQVILPNNSAYLFKATVISGVTGGGNTSGWKLEGVIKRGANAASTAIVGTVTTTLLAQDAGASGWVIAATADTTNGGLRITFTGQASTTIRTVCKVETTEMTY